LLAWESNGRLANHSALVQSSTPAWERSDDGHGWRTHDGRERTDEPQSPCPTRSPKTASPPKFIERERGVD
jgi:hypothetical protein